MVKIHPTAVVSSNAIIGVDVEIGPFCIIEDDVEIGDGSKIRSNVLIDSGVRLGKNVQVFSGAVLGTAPQDLKYKGEKTYLEVGDNTIIREYATLNRGTNFSWKTTVGSNCLLMAYVHVAHDCVLGNNVILSNSVNMAGHVTIEDYVIIGGLTAIHQFVRIGQHTMIGGGYRVPKDVPPYILAMGEPLQFGGLNAVGLTRRGFSSEVQLALKRAYKLVFRSSLTKNEAIERLKIDFADVSEVQNIVTFLQKCERGIIKGR
jgi:UDP-N-acetylglucosamine acyltransferase